MSLRLVQFSGVLAIAAAVGCGGSESVNLSQDGGDQEGGDATSGGMDSGASDGASGSDATSDGTVFSRDGGTPLDAGPGGSTTSLTCGTTSCALPSESCCVNPAANPPPDFSYSCAVGGCPDAGGGGNGTTALKCSGAANCPASTVCCVRQSPPNGASSDCQASCGANEAQLCDPAAAAPGCAADAGACSNANIGDWGLPSSFGTCGGVGN